MTPGDTVITTSDERIYVGDVTGEWSWQKSEGGRSNLRRTVEWRNADAPIDFVDLPAPLPANLASGSTIVDLTSELDLIDDLAAPTSDGAYGDPSGSTLVRAILPMPSTTLAEDLLVEASWLAELRTYWKSGNRSSSTVRPVPVNLMGGVGHLFPLTTRAQEFAL